MIARERVLAALSHEEPEDRIPIYDSTWASTIDRWHEEGLPLSANPVEYFGYDITSFTPDCSPRFPVQTVEETDRYVIHTTPYGGLRRDLKDYSATPETIDYPVKSREDWERIKERLVPGRDRVDWDGTWGGDTAEDERGATSILERGRRERRRGRQGCQQARQQGLFTCYYGIVGYDKMQFYMSSEKLLMTIATDAGWVRDMYETDADLVIQQCEIMKEGGFEFDGAFLCCDLGYRNGLLFSPRHFKEQLRPTFRRLFDYFQGEGLPVILHSCGRVRDLIPYFIEDGLACLQPLEVKAGMDLLALKEAYGDRIAFMGGIDARSIADPDPAIIEEELRTKLSAAKKGGGYIYHSDHSIPNNVSFDRYCKVLELVRKYGAY